MASPSQPTDHLSFPSMVADNMCLPAYHELTGWHCQPSVRIHSQSQEIPGRQATVGRHHYANANRSVDTWAVASPGTPPSHGGEGSPSFPAPPARYSVIGIYGTIPSQRPYQAGARICAQILDEPIYQTNISTLLCLRVLQRQRPGQRPADQGRMLVKQAWRSLLPEAGSS